MTYKFQKPRIYASIALKHEACEKFGISLPVLNNKVLVLGINSEKAQEIRRWFLTKGCAVTWEETVFC